MADNASLAGKTVIVSGAASGLGRAMALGLAAAGARVAALDINEEGANATAAVAPAGRVLPVRADVRHSEDCAGAVRRTLTELGGLHGVVNCAGLGMSWLRRDFLSTPLRFWEVEPDGWQQIMDVNVRGPFLLARAAVRHLLDQGWGRIVNVTTSFNTMIRGANMPYGQSKASLEAASCAWAADLAGTGVTVNILVPGGAADTPMIPEDSPYAREKLVRPEVMVAPVCWLMSEAADGITGMRFIGRDWNPALPAEENIKRAGAPAAWPELAKAAGAAQDAAGGIRS